MAKYQRPSIPWVEKYRPLLLDDVVLEPLNRELFVNILDMDYFPNLLIYGSPGCGKTTICVNLINEHQKRYNKVNKSNVIHLNASDERGIDIIRNQILQFVKSKNLFESGLKFVILDEVDYMTKNAQQALKYILQTSTNNVRFCLICNYITKIDESLKNEFICIRINQLPKMEILRFIRRMASMEDMRITDETIEEIRGLFNFDVRSMINYMQLNESIINNSNSVYMNQSVLEKVHKFVICEKNDNLSFVTFIRKVSIEYNIDERSVIQKYINHLILNYPKTANSDFIKSIEIILHRHDIPLKIHVMYLFNIINDCKKLKD
jgi:replication-associated recombination protein RarA